MADVDSRVTPADGESGHEADADAPRINARERHWDECEIRPRVLPETIRGNAFFGRKALVVWYAHAVGPQRAYNAGQSEPFDWYIERYEGTWVPYQLLDLSDRVARESHEGLIRTLTGDGWEVVARHKQGTFSPIVWAWRLRRLSSRSDVASERHIESVHPFTQFE